MTITESLTAELARLNELDAKRTQGKWSAESYSTPKYYTKNAYWRVRSDLPGRRSKGAVKSPSGTRRASTTGS